MRSFAFAAAALAFAGLASTPAFADTGHSHTPHIAVAYDDLNLSSAAGADAMLSRLETAARRVCRGAGNGYRGLAQREARLRCQEDTMTVAVASLNSPVLTARFEGATTPIVTAAAW